MMLRIGISIALLLAGSLFPGKVLAYLTPCEALGVGGEDCASSRSSAPGGPLVGQSPQDSAPPATPSSGGGRWQSPTNVAPSSPATENFNPVSEPLPPADLPLPSLPALAPLP